MGIALLHRLLWALIAFHVAGLSAFLDADSYSYIHLAQRLVQGNGFTTGQHLPLIPETLRTPGYPLFLAMFMRLSDYHWLGLVIGSQLLLDSLCVLLIMRLARALGNESAAVAGGLYYALAILPAASAKYVHTETIFGAIFCLALYLFYRLKLRDLPEHPDHNRFPILQCLCAGLLFGVSALIRPIGFYPLIAFFLITIGISVCSTRRGGRELALLAAMMAAFLLLPGAWIARNCMLTDYRGLASVDAINLLFYRVAAVEAMRSGREVAVLKRQYANELGLRGNPPGSPWSESINEPEWPARATRIRNIAIARILRDLPGYCILAIKGAARLAFSGYVPDVFMVAGPAWGHTIKPLLALIMVPIWLLALRGWIRRWQLWPIALLTVLIIAVSAGGDTYSRFRLPIEPLLAISFGCGL